MAKIRKFVLSTVGASMFGHALTTSERDSGWMKKLMDTANLSETEMPPEVAKKLDELRSRLSAQLVANKPEENRKMSAELNGIYGIYDNQIQNGNGDQHWLIATDTLQGRLACELVQEFLRAKGLTASIYQPPSLSTRNTQSFGRGMKNLIGWCEDQLPPYLSSGYKVTFNLVGGFKSLQGYLNVIGMFYADEVVYIFETSDQLIRIPRLPISISDDDLRGNTVELAMLASAVDYYPTELTDRWQIPDAFLEDVDSNHVILSAWGTLIWNKTKPNLLATDSPLSFPRINYGPDFRKHFREVTPNEKVELQEKLARVAALLDLNKGDTVALKRDNELKYENYANKNNAGAPIGHFRLNNQGDRVSCTSQEGSLLLRKFGAHDEVNDNP